jgi:hypothetical protein
LEAVLILSWAFVGSVVMFLVTPFIRNRFLSGVFWLLVALGYVTVLNPWVAQDMNTASWADTLIGVVIMIVIGGLLMLRRLPFVTFSLAAFAVWFGLGFGGLGIQGFAVAGFGCVWLYLWRKKFS